MLLRFSELSNYVFGAATTHVVKEFNHKKQQQSDTYIKSTQNTDPWRKKTWSNKLASQTRKRLQPGKVQTCKGLHQGLQIINNLLDKICIHVETCAGARPHTAVIYAWCGVDGCLLKPCVLLPVESWPYIRNDLDELANLLSFACLRKVFRFILSFAAASSLSS